MSDEPKEPDMGDLLRQAQEMQERLVEAHEEVAATVVEGQAGGGVVKVAVNGALEFQSVTISPEAVDPDDIEMLEDLVLAALHDASARLVEVQGASTGGLDLGDLDLGGLLGGESTGDG